MGRLTFNLNVTLDGCTDHREGVADEETHEFFTRLLEDHAGLLWGRTTYEMMESYWPGVARGETPATPAMRAWAITLDAYPKYVVSSTRTDFPWANTHHLQGDLGEAVQELKDATPKGVLLGSGHLAVQLDRLGLIDDYRLMIHPVIAGHGPRLHEDFRSASRKLELVASQTLTNGVLAVHYRRAG